MPFWVGHHEVYVINIGADDGFVGVVEAYSGDPLVVAVPDVEPVSMYSEPRGVLSLGVEGAVGLGGHVVTVNLQDTK